MSSFFAPGARSNAATFSLTSVSLSAIPLIVTLPVFSTVTVYATLSPTFTPEVGDALFVTVSAAFASSVVTVACACASAGSSPRTAFAFAFTVLVKLPASTSACVTV